MEQTFYPEMGQTKPAAAIDAFYAVGRYMVKTPLTLSGRGVTFRGVLKASDLVPQAQHKAGWNSYTLTPAAYRRICAEHSVSRECLLD